MNFSLRRAVAVMFIVFMAETISYAQQNYIEGKIFNDKGDTTKVLIDYRNWEKSPKKISYKKSPDDEPTEVKPGEIKGFIVSDEMYISAVVEKDINVFKVNEVKIQDDLNPSMNLVKDIVFLQTIIKGEKSLYHYKEIDDKDLFYIEEDGEYQLLVYYRYYKKNEAGKKYAVDNTKYKGQLTVYLENTPEVQAKLKATDYNRKGLRRLFDTYYQATNKKVEFQKEIQKMTAEVGVIAGASITSLQFKSDYIDYLDNTIYPKSVDFAGGIFLDLRQARNNGKWSLLNELFYTKYNTSGSYTYTQYSIYKYVTHTEFGFAYLKLNTMIRYRIPLKGVTLFMNAGMSNGYAISQTNKMVEEYYISDVLDNREESNALAAPRRYEQGVLAGLGATFNRFSVEARYESGNGLDYGSGDSSTSLYESAAKRVYFLIGYRFK